MSTFNEHTIIENYGPMVSALCTRMIQNRETAKDASQETWYQIIKSLPNFKEHSSPSTWIFTIARRVILRYAVKERLYTTRHLKNYFEDDHEPPGPEQDNPEYQIWIREMCDQCLTGILHCLDNESRLAYLFRDMADLTYKEISAILDRKEPDVRKRISRARKKLNHFLHNQCTLYNPEGACRCRMARHVKEINLPEEYKKLRLNMHRIRLFKEAGHILPLKNYWEKFL